MSATVGFRSRVSVNDTAAGATFTAVAGAVQITLPERVVELVEVTALDEADDYKRYVASPLKDGGALKLQVYYTSANLVRFEALLGKQWQSATAKTAWRFAPPDADGAGPLLAKQIQFDGIVTKLGEATFSRDPNAVVFDVEIKVNSAWAITDLPNATP